MVYSCDMSRKQESSHEMSVSCCGLCSRDQNCSLTSAFNMEQGANMKDLCGSSCFATCERNLGAGKKAQWLITIAVIAENLGFIPRHMMVSNYIKLQFQRI